MGWYNQEMILGFSVAQLWVFFGPLVSGLVAAFGVHIFSRRRENEKVRKEWLAKRLEQAYLLLADAIEIPGLSPDEELKHKQNLQKAIKTIDLYGDNKAMIAAREILDGYSEQRTLVEYGALQSTLRDNLRKIIGLEKLKDPVLRINFQKKPVNPKPID